MDRLGQHKQSRRGRNLPSESGADFLDLQRRVHALPELLVEYLTFSDALVDALLLSGCGGVRCIESMVLLLVYMSVSAVFRQ